MIALRLVACLSFFAVAACSIPQGKPIGASRLVIAQDAAGLPILTAPSCPDWGRDSREDFSNRVASNFGCADAVNFIGQLARAGDAVAGRAAGAEDGGAAAGSVERYRTRKTVPLVTGSGTSDVSRPSTGGPS